MRLSRERIWIVDDSRVAAMQLQQLLGPTYELETFVDGLRALEALSAGPAPDLVVLDWEMPELSGLETCRLIRAQHNEADLPILMLTGREGPAALAEALEAGANDFLRKPVQEIELLARTRAQLLVRRSAQRLSASEAVLRLVTDAIPLPISFIGVDERYTMVNKAYEEWFGLTRAQVVGHTVEELIGPAARAIILPRIRRALDGERLSWEEHGVPYRYGGERDIRGEFVPHRGDGGHVDGFVGLLRDITTERAFEIEREASLAREKAARAEAQSERTKQHSLFMQAPVAIAILEGAQHTFSFANPAFRALVNGRDVLGKPLLEALPDLRGQGFAKLLDRVLATGETHVGNEQPLTIDRDGVQHTTVINFVYQAKRDAAGRPDGVLISAFDVTEQVTARRQVEALAEELLTSEERQRRALQASGAGLWDLDTATGKIDADPRVIELMGLPAGSELDRVSALAQLPAAERAAAGAAMEAALAGENGGRYVAEFRTGGHDGAPVRWIESIAQATFGADGKAAHLAGGMVDITTRRAAEAERESARAVEKELRQAAEIANRSKDEFLAMLGHEMRNPLAPISTALQLMRLRGGEAFIEERSVIERQVKHLAGLVDDLLDISRITSGKVELHRERLNLATVVASAIEMASPLFEQRRHHLRIAVAADGLLVDGDALRLAQVASNLLTNAAKYTEPGGEIDVAAAREGDEIVLRVRDNGVGIAADMLPKVFELFAQERQSIDRARGGLGLGLAIVRTMVRMHGGSVTAHSEGRGRGSEFTLRLPVARPVAATTAAAPRERSPGASATVAAKRILLVDDNVDAAELMATTLELLGHELRVAYDGPSALALLAEFTPDVAVLDIGLPVMDGYELARRLRERPELARLRMVALTGYGQGSDRQRSVDAGFDAHVVKPVQVAALEAIIDGREHFDDHRE